MNLNFEIGPSRGGLFRWPVLLAAALLWIAARGPLTAQESVDSRDVEIEQLKKIIAALEARVAALENRSNASSSSPPPADVSGNAPLTGTEADSAKAPLPGGFSPSGAETLDESAIPVASAESEKNIEFKGALRYNLRVDDQDEASESKKGSSGFDLFRIGAAGSYENFLISAEYRFYSYMNTLHHGWMGYDFEAFGQIQVGVSQVPFGILPYASHNYWFGVPYYLGLSDDYDLGLKLLREAGPWDFHVAFYKNEELGDATDLDRYSFDVVSLGEEHANEETNQFNARVAYTIGKGTDSIHEFGFSAQAGQLYNRVTNDLGDHWAAALHLDSRYKRWNFQLELARYAYNPANPNGRRDDRIRLGAFATSYEISAAANVGVLNLAYNVPISLPGIDSITVYSDFSIVDKDIALSEDSILVTTGAAAGAGPLFVYLDLIQAKNMVFFGDGSLADGGNTDWSTRFNLNLGYYW